MLFERYKNKTFCLFSKSGFSAGMEKYAFENNVMLVELHNLYDTTKTTPTPQQRRI
jgi:hypothetical protein